MTYEGVLQTSDGEEAVELAQRLVAGGRHIRCNRIGFTNLKQELELMEKDPDGYVQAMNEHDPVEYEVYVELRDWRNCNRVGCPVIIDDLKANRYPGLCDRCQYYEPKDDKHESEKDGCC